MIYKKNPVTIYTAGEMNESSSWRMELEQSLKSIPIKWNHPNNNYGHSDLDPSEVVSKDMQLIDDSDLIIAYFNRSELYGTITEVMYALPNKLLIVIINPKLPCVLHNHDYGSAHNNTIEFNNRHAYWFLQYMLLEKGIRIFESEKEIKAPLLELLKKRGFPTTLYQEYINSDEWRGKSISFKLEKRGVCEMCNTDVGFKGLNTHHIHYPKNLKKDDNQKNWIAVCKTCHNKLHGITQGSDIRTTKNDKMRDLFEF